MTPENRLTFGILPKEEATFRRRSAAARKEPQDNQEVYGVYKFLPAIERILVEDDLHWKEEHKAKKKQQQEILEALWGPGVEVPSYMSPSTASYCVRWIGYEKLDYKPAPTKLKSMLAMMMGSAAHYSMMKKIESAIPGRQETVFTIDEADLSGRADFYFRNPKTDEFQILEFKFVSDFVFRKISRTDLPEYMRSTRDVYAPEPEHYRQVLLYLWAKRKQGDNAMCANVIYVNRNTGEMKEALVYWNPATEYDAEQLIDEIHGAKVCIDKGELPEPNVESPHVCSGFCPYRQYCEFGQKFAAGQVRRDKKRRPNTVYNRLRKDVEETKKYMIDEGIVQGELPGFVPEGSGPAIKTRERTTEKVVPREKVIKLGETKETLKGGVCPKCGKPELIFCYETASLPDKTGVVSFSGKIRCTDNVCGFWKGKIMLIPSPVRVVRDSPKGGK